MVQLPSSQILNVVRDYVFKQGECSWYLTICFPLFSSMYHHSLLPVSLLLSSQADKIVYYNAKDDVSTT